MPTVHTSKYGNESEQDDSVQSTSLRIFCLHQIVPKCALWSSSTTREIGNVVCSWEHYHWEKAWSSINKGERESGYWRNYEWAPPTPGTIKRSDQMKQQTAAIARAKLITICKTFVLFKIHFVNSIPLLNILNKIEEHKDNDVSLSRNNPRKAESMINRKGRRNQLSLSLKLFPFHEYFFLGLDWPL